MQKPARSLVRYICDDIRNVVNDTRWHWLIFISFCGGDSILSLFFSFFLSCCEVLPFYLSILAILCDYLTCLPIWFSLRLLFYVSNLLSWCFYRQNDFLAFYKQQKTLEKKNINRALKTREKTGGQQQQQKLINPFTTWKLDSTRIAKFHSTKIITFYFKTR